MQPEKEEEGPKTIYAYRTFNSTGDRTRNIRKLLDSAKKDGERFKSVQRTVESPDFLQNTLPKALELKDKKPESIEETKSRIEALKNVQDTLQEAYYDGGIAEGSQNYIDGPKQALDDASKKINAVRMENLEDLPLSRKEEVLGQIQNLQERLEAWKKVLKDEDAV